MTPDHRGPVDRPTRLRRLDHVQRRYDLWAWLFELGVGAGANFPHYPVEARVKAIDISPGMLDRARKRAARDGVRVG
ncbi:MAG TPA: class I SAM-dependent methyltransferase, partial [Bacillota bacterium]